MYLTTLPPARRHDEDTVVATFEDLVPGINPSFLRERLVVPLEMVDGALHWGTVEGTSGDTLDALRFASQRATTTVILPEDAICALLGDDSNHAKVSSVSSRAIPHAEAVVKLRSYLVDALSVSADRIEIRHATGLLVLRRGDDTLSSYQLSPLEAETLAAAAVALTDEETARDESPRFAVSHRGMAVCVLVESSATGADLILLASDVR